MSREIVLDTETTGVDPLSGHRIVEIGCIELMGGVPTGNSFQAYLNPGRPMPEEALRVHGLTDEFLSDKPVFAEIVEDFLNFIADAPLVIHNAAFDMRFINAELERLGFTALPMERTTDTVLMARKKYPGSPANLDALCRRFNVDASARTKHGALLDAELLAEVYLEMMGGRQAALLLDTQETGIAGVAVQVERKLRALREFLPSAEELEAHARLIAKLKKPLWLNG